MWVWVWSFIRALPTASACSQWCSDDAIVYSCVERTKSCQIVVIYHQYTAILMSDGLNRIITVHLVFVFFLTLWLVCLHQDQMATQITLCKRKKQSSQCNSKSLTRLAINVSCWEAIVMGKFTSKGNQTAGHFPLVISTDSRLGLLVTPGSTRQHLQPTQLVPVVRIYRMAYPSAL